MVWSVETGARLIVIEGHEDAISAVCFSPDGKTIVSASRDGEIRLWPVFYDLLELGGVELFEQAERDSGLKLSGFELKQDSR